MHQEVRDGLLAVSSSLRMFRDFEPAKLFFVLPANVAVLGSIASIFFSVSEHYALPDDLSDSALTGCVHLFSTGKVFF